jgi:hypothetical protein
MYKETRTGKRLPQLASRDEVPEDELRDYDRLMKYVEKYSSENAIAQARPLVDGQPYAYPYRVAFTNAPRLAMLLIDCAYGVNDMQGQAGMFSASDHEWIDLVLGCDSGYWAFHAGHTANAVTTGIRIEAIEALHGGREEEFTDDERQVVAFIRAVRDGTMTDEQWDAMTERLGTVRGTISFAFLTTTLWAIQHLMWAMGVPAIDKAQWEEMFRGYKDGTLDPARQTQDWIWDFVGKPRPAWAPQVSEERLMDPTR